MQGDLSMLQNACKVLVQCQSPCYTFHAGYLFKVIYSCHGMSEVLVQCQSSMLQNASRILVQGDLWMLQNSCRVFVHALYRILVQGDLFVLQNA